jgi:hypothetical protein
LAWTADGQLLAISRERGFGRTSPGPRIAVVSPTTWDVRELGDGWNPVWSASGHYLAFYSIDPQPVPRVLVVDAQTGERLGDVSPDAMGFGWKEDGLLYVQNGAVHLWTRSADVSLGSIAGLGVAPDIVLFSSTGDRLITANRTVGAPSWRNVAIRSLGDSMHVDLTDAVQASWSPTGHRLLVDYADRVELRTADGKLLQQRGRDPQQLHLWLGTSDAVLLGVPHAGLPASGFADFAVWDGASSGLVRLPELSLNLGAKSAFSPDLRLFAALQLTPTVPTLGVFRCQ